MVRDQVLVVEDDLSVQEVIALSLSDKYEVKQAATGAEALSILRRDPVAAVVLDYRLPDRTGLEVLTDIRVARPRLPVIMITGYGSEGVCASALKLGIRDYFPKPLDVFDLSRSVRRLLSAERAPGEGAPEDRFVEARAPAPSACQYDLAIQRTALLIQRRYWDQLTLSGLAHEVGMSKCWLSRRFKQDMGITLRSYLLAVRLERAKELLAARQTSITQVALTVGFSDLPRFDKLFKRYTGLTPSAYRSLALSRSNK